MFWFWLNDKSTTVYYGGKGHYFSEDNAFSKGPNILKQNKDFSWANHDSCSNSLNVSFVYYTKECLL